MTTRRSRRTALLVGGALTLALPLAGCGFNDQTNQVYQPAVGPNSRNGEVDVLAAVIVSQEAGSGAIVATLSNQRPNADRLTAVQAAGGSDVDFSSPVEIPASGFVNLADDDGIPITGDDVTAKEGGYLKVRFSFANADPVTMNVPMVFANGPYRGLGSPAASSSASPSGTPSGSPSASPSE